jgi:hypothetical protein
VCNGGACVGTPTGYPTGQGPGPNPSPPSNGVPGGSAGTCNAFTYCLRVTQAVTDPTLCTGGGRIAIQNGCGSSVTISACLGRNDGTWDCGEQDIAPGGTFTYWACDVNGVYCDQGVDPALWGTGCALTHC